MLHHDSGFSAGLRLLPSPHSTLGPTLSRCTNPEIDLVELAPAMTDQPFAYVEGGAQRQGVRVLFARLAEVKRVEGLEAFAAFVRVGEEKPILKVYAMGEGVQQYDGAWFIDAVLPIPPVEPSKAMEVVVMLSLHKVQLKPGTKLGSGHLLSGDVATMSQKAEVSFSWHVLSHAHLELFGLLPRDPPLPALPPPPPSAASIALSFLRRTTHTLVSLLTPEQRLAFMDKLAKDEEAVGMLPEGVRGELEGFSRSSTGGGVGGGMVGKAGGGVRGEGVKEEEEGGEKSWETMFSISEDGQALVNGTGHPEMVFSAHGFTVQLFISGQSLTAYQSSSPSQGTTSLSYTSPLPFLPQTEFAVVWRDDRPEEMRGPIAGTVWIALGEGEGGAGGQEEMVGQKAFDERKDEVWPSVRGQLGCKCSAFKLTLLVQAGGINATEYIPLAMLAFYVTSSALSSPIKPESPLIKLDSPPAYATRSHYEQQQFQVKQESPFHHVKEESPFHPAHPHHHHHHSQHHPQPAMVTIASDEYVQMTKDLEAAKESLKHFETSSSTFYRLLALPSRISYLEARLRTEVLSPAMRCSVGLAKREAEMELEAQGREACGGEFRGLLGAVVGQGQG